MRRIFLFSVIASLVWISCCGQGVKRHSASDKQTTNQTTDTEGVNPQHPLYVDTEIPSEGFVRFCERIDPSDRAKKAHCYEESLAATEIRLFNIYDLEPISKMKKLQKIFISMPLPISLEPLRDLADLEELTIEALYCGSSIEGHVARYGSIDLSPLANLTKLKTLKTGCTDVEGLQALSNLTDLTEITFERIRPELRTPDFARGLKEFYTDKSSDSEMRVCFFLEEDRWGKRRVSCRSQSPDEEEIGFSGLVDTSPLAKAVGAQSLELWIENKRQSNLEPLRNLPRLSRLKIETTRPVDLSPVGNLSNLEYLYLTGPDCLDNRQPIVFDVSFLSHLHKLKELELNCMSVDDLKAFKGLTALNVLRLDETRSKDGFAPIRYLKKLKELFANAQEFESLDGFQELTDLEKLTIPGTSVSDLSPIQNLKKVGRLNLSGTKVVDLSPLSNWKVLYALYIDHTKISDLTPLSRLTFLNDLWARNSGVEDYSPLSGVDGITNVETGETIAGIRPFIKMRTLERLYLGRFPKEEIPLVKKLSCCRYDTTAGLSVSDAFTAAEKEEIDKQCASVRVPGREQLRGPD